MDNCPSFSLQTVFSSVSTISSSFSSKHNSQSVLRLKSSNVERCKEAQHVKLRYIQGPDAVTLHNCIGYSNFSYVCKGSWNTAPVAVKFLLFESFADASRATVLFSSITPHPCIVETYFFDAANVDDLEEKLFSKASRRNFSSTSSKYKSASSNGSSLTPPDSESLHLLAMQEPFEPLCEATLDCQEFDASDGKYTLHCSPTLSLSSVLASLGAQPQQYIVRITMELCDMGTLQQAISNRLFCATPRWSALLGLRALITTALEVAQGMSHLHSLGITHADLSANNVLLKSSRKDLRGFVAKVADFSLSRLSDARRSDCRASASVTAVGEQQKAAARHTETGVQEVADCSDVQLFPSITSMTAATNIAGHATSCGARGTLGSGDGHFPVGTAAYMAPEAIAGATVPASDVYSFGVLLWHMATCRTPYGDTHPVAIMGGVLTGDLSLNWDDVPLQPLRQLGQRAMARDPSARPSWGSILRKLSAIQEHLSAWMMLHGPTYGQQIKPHTAHDLVQSNDMLGLQRQCNRSCESAEDVEGSGKLATCRRSCKGATAASESDFYAALAEYHRSKLGLESAEREDEEPSNVQEQDMELNSLALSTGSGGWLEDEWAPKLRLPLKALKLQS